MKGFYNKLLLIDLNNRVSDVINISDEVLKSNLGGKGLGTHLLLKYNKKGIDPFDEENHLIFTMGPLSDSRIFGSSRYAVFTKSPLTELYGESYSGGSAVIGMSRTGYDAIILRGKSDKPIWLNITDNDISFLDAKDIWGKNTFDTEEIISTRVKKKSNILVIGPAGENLVKFAVIKNDKWRVAGRTGMGAVLGSKKIKAIAFSGTKKRDFYDPKGMNAYAKNTYNKLKNHNTSIAYKNFGTPMSVEILNKKGAFPTRYWQKGVYDKWLNIDALSMHENLKVKPNACSICFLACGKISEVKTGRHKGLKLEGPEYETIYSFGGLCEIDKIEEIAYLNNICDSLGIDTITGGNLAGLAIEAYKKGKNKRNIDYGDVDGIAKFLNDITYRKNDGDIFAEGIKNVGKVLDMEDFTIHVKGLEPAGYDPRVLKGMGLAYAVNERGACHLRSTFYKAELSGVIEPDKTIGKAEIFIDYEDRATLFDSLILCRFYRDFYLWDELSEIIGLSTGLTLNKNELKIIASNIKTNTRLFNLREGMDYKADSLPKRFYTEEIENGAIIKEQELNLMVQDYYKIRGWNSKGIPVI